MHYWVPSPDNLMSIHTWAHLALTTHMKAGWVNNPQVALTSLKRLFKDTPPQGLKACKSPPVSNPIYTGFWMRG